MSAKREQGFEESRQKDLTFGLECLRASARPRKARLCARPEDYRFSSAWFRARERHSTVALIGVTDTSPVKVTGKFDTNEVQKTSA